MIPWHSLTDFHDVYRFHRKCHIFVMQSKWNTKMKILLILFWCKKQSAWVYYHLHFTWRVEWQYLYYNAFTAHSSRWKYGLYMFGVKMANNNNFESLFTLFHMVFIQLKWPENTVLLLIRSFDTKIKIKCSYGIYFIHSWLINFNHKQ